jgi:WD40 repeat protein
MKTNASFDDSLAAWLEEDSAHRVPDHLDELLVFTAATRQQQWWSSPGRWLPMDVGLRNSPFGLSLRLRPVVILVILALIVALAVAALTVGSRPRLPPPIGVARNGAVVYTFGGDIQSLDTTTNRSMTLVGGTENDRTPRLSPDGTRMIFDRELPGDQHQLMIAAADGTGVRPLGPPIAEMDPIVWSPDGTRMAVSSIIAGKVGVRIIDLEGNVALVLPQDPGTATEAVQDVQWRPDGQGLVLRAWQPGGPFGLYTVHADGTDLHRILGTADQDRESFSPALSPDGKTVAYSYVDEGRILMADVGSGADRSVSFTSEGQDYFPFWSPDGSLIAFQRASGATALVAVASATGGAVVETGPAFTAFEGPNVRFSPDGSKLIAWYPNTSSTWLLDPAGGPAELLSFDSTELASWQRLAP